MGYNSLKIDYYGKALIYEYIIINGWLRCDNVLNNTLKFKSKESNHE